MGKKDDIFRERITPTMFHIKAFKALGKQ